MKRIYWFKEINRKNLAIAGGKGANLGEMTNIGLPVPPGFVISAPTYFEFVNKTGIQKKILKLVDIDVNDTKALQKASEDVEKLIVSTPIPHEIRHDIVKAYEEMRAKAGDDLFVAIRSSATAEDLPEASFAGQQATFLEIRGVNDVVRAVQKCWASLYTPRAIFYRVQNKFDHAKVGLCAVVQKMIHSDSAGVMFTSEPTGDTTKVIVEGAFGLGEAVVSGSVTPDTYVVDKKTLKIEEKRIKRQEFKIVRKPGSIGTINVKLSPEEGRKQKITDGQITAFAKLGKRIEAHYKHPQDIEWAVEKGVLYIVQSRAITTLGIGKQKADKAINKKPIVTGMSASPGVASGPVKIIHKMRDITKIVKGDILVTKMTTPDMVPVMKKAGAIVTDDGGSTCHAAIVSRELGIPCIVGTDHITKSVKDKQMVTVDAFHGNVYDGMVAIQKRYADVSKIPKTKTHVYVNLAVPDRAREVSKLPADGVGLMREEFIIASVIKEHPLNMIKQGRSKEFVNKLAHEVSKVARNFYPRPVVLRFSDFKTNEYHDLVGGDKYEPKEENPMIGWRGCSRYYSPAYKEGFKLELRAVKKVRKKYKNLWVMLPFVRTVDEVIKITKIMENEGLKRGPDFKLWLMAEVPSVAILAEEFAKYCDGFSIGSNDLTQLVLGVDRDSQIMGNMGLFDAKNPAVMNAVSMIIKGAHKQGKTVSLCGQAPSQYPEFAEFLVREGIDSMSVNIDVVVQTRQIVAKAEKKLKKK